MNLIASLRLIAAGGRVSMLRSVKWEFAHAVLLGAPSGLLIVVIWELFKASPDMGVLRNVLIAMTALLLLQFYVAGKAMIVSNGVGYEISANGRMKLGEHLRKLPMGFFKRRDPGDITTVLLQDMDNVEMMLSHSIGNLYNAVFGALLMGSVLLYLDWRLALALLGGIAVGIPFIWIGTRITTRLGKQHKQSLNRTGSRFLEYVLGIRYIKAHGLGGEKFRTLEDALRRLRTDSIRMEAVPGPLALVPLVFAELGFLGMAALGLYYQLGGSLTIPVFAAMLIMGYRFYEPLRILMVDMIVLRYMKVGVDRVVDVLQTPTPAEPERDEPLERFDIAFDGVRFAYLDKHVLNGVSFQLPEKSLTALVGPSGSGKTTIASLVCRFWETQEGEIRIGGRPLASIRQDRLFASISQVFQDVYLFNDTIYNNIKVGRPDASGDDIVKAAARAHCLEFIERLPDGMHTVVGEGGSRLSGGQKQRISIARALLKDAPILLLDEATASLDPENEVYIQQAIAELVTGKTVVVIAHKLQTIRHADQIIVLNDGRIEEQGKHEELMEAGGLYALLWNEQQKAGAWKVQGNRVSADTKKRGSDEGNEI